AAVRQSITASFNPTTAPPRFELMISGTTPVPLVFMVVADAGDGAAPRELGKAVMRPNPNSSSTYYFDWATAIPPSLKLMLRPNAREAEKSLDIVRYWDQEIVITAAQIQRLK